MIKKIISNKLLFAIIIKANHHKKGIEFLTPNDFSQQLAFMNHPRGKIIPPHIHNPVTRSVTFTREALFIRNGKVRVDFYTDSKEYVESKILKSGDMLLLVNGGHGFTMLEPTEMIEVKQGPYAGEADKTRFEGINKTNINLK